MMRTRLVKIKRIEKKEIIMAMTMTRTITTTVIMKIMIIRIMIIRITDFTGHKLYHPNQ